LCSTCYIEGHYSIAFCRDHDSDSFSHRQKISSGFIDYPEKP